MSRWWGISNVQQTEMSSSVSPHLFRSWQSSSWYVDIKKFLLQIFSLFSMQVCTKTW